MNDDEVRIEWLKRWAHNLLNKGKVEEGGTVDVEVEALVVPDIYHPDSIYILLQAPKV